MIGAQVLIRYSLKCGSKHEFEAWFRNSGGYDELRAAGEVSCPVCGDGEIVKAPMAPSVPRKGNQKSETARRRTAELSREVFEAVGKLRRHVEENCDYVGGEFADEARKIHYGETEERGIYGEATPVEARELDDEGIEVYSLPKLTSRAKN